MFGRFLILVFLVLAVAIWASVQISRFYFSFTTDAYVLTDVVTVAPTVAGPISELHVDDNDVVDAGDVLFEIDPRPYQYAEQAARAALAAAQSDFEAAKASLAVAQDQVDAAEATLTDSQQTFDRVSALVDDGVSTEQRLDDLTQNLQNASADLNAAKDGVILAQDGVKSAEARMSQASAALATATYQLEQTQVAAPFDGFVLPFTLRQGSYLAEGDPAMAVVDDKTWRIVANLPESHLAYVRPGQRVLLMVSSMPWTLLRGRVLSIPRGVARSEDPPQAVPYVAQTTSWIRLAQRFPVEIAIDDVETIPLFMGANATVFIWHAGEDGPSLEAAQ
ncbi:MAG: HlyD family efflux transporter periplasmic adaptor subunit [Pseudomonadota bacterium]